MLLELLSAGKVGSSGSSGVGRGEGKWMLVRSGREPPVLWVAGIRAVVFSWSADGKMLGRGGGKGQTETEVSSQDYGWPILPQKLWQGQEKAGAKALAGAKLSPTIRCCPDEETPVCSHLQWKLRKQPIPAGRRLG